MFDLRKKFPKPASILADNYNTYLVISLIIVIVISGFSLITPFFYFSERPELSIFALINIAIWIAIWSINKRGKHLAATVMICIALYLSAVLQVFYIGWDAGFQYQLIAEMALLLLYPHRNLIVPSIFSGLILITFLLLYFLTSDIDIERTNFIVQLHTFNAVITMLALGATTLFFRTNTVKLINKLKLTSNTDPLTGLLNRRRMNIELTEHSDINKRYEQTNSLILIDVDLFKDINDTYGHGGGDQILVQFSSLLKSIVRTTDLLSRWGGEEFLILLPFTDIKNAANAAEKIRKNVEAHSFLIANNQINITITSGVTELNPHSSIEDALKQVDKLLYHGKNNGRNQVVVQTPLS